MNPLLKRLQALRGNVAPTDPGPAPQSGLHDAAGQLGAQLRQHPEHGTHFELRETMPPETTYGTVPLGRPHLHPLLLDERTAPAPKVLYVDTETTGLSGGTGTLAFLIGAGLHGPDGFEVRQLFLPGPEHEAAQLQAFAALARDASAVVTYNGGSFDLPLLRNRFALQGLDDPLYGVPHLDLLPLARRLWRGTLPDCSLATVERFVLGKRRAGTDVPGREVPARYAGWLRSRESALLMGVLEHNVNDIAAMSALRHYLEELLEDPARGRPAEQHGLGLWLERLGRTGEALERLLHAARARPEAAWQASLLLKRSGRLGEAAELWRSLGRQGMVAAWVELAKLHEHRERDYAAALEATEAAVQANGRPDAELDRRRERLLRRLTQAGYSAE